MNWKQRIYRFPFLLYIMFQILLVLCFLVNASFAERAKDAKDAKVCNILSFSGAGSFGAVEVGILDRMSSSLPTFDMLTGVSAGGLNVGFLSYYSVASQNLKTRILK